VPGNKLIEEFIGKMANNESSVSVAHMIAPPNWSEPHQKPMFDEITIMIRGKMQVVTENETIILQAGEVFLVNKNVKVQYSNPFNEENEYWAICIPAFSVDSAGR
jgi:ethanolamine utilization protein EutQ (cupin superfamily)